MEMGGVDARLERNEVANGGPLSEGNIDRVLPSDEAVPKRRIDRTDLLRDSVLPIGLFRMLDEYKEPSLPSAPICNC